MVSKRINGQKRHLVVDTQGLLLGVAVTEANLQDLLERLTKLVYIGVESSGLCHG